MPNTPSSPPLRRHWALLANPNRYDIDTALVTLTEDVWEVPLGETQHGDRAVIWRTRGPDPHRGIVAFAEILTAPVDMTEPVETQTLWKGDPPPVRARRIRVRYVFPPNLPLWLDQDSTGLLDELSVSRGQGTKLYKITTGQWQRLLDLAGGWPEDDLEEQLSAAQAAEATRASQGQGFLSDSESRAAVELRAMDSATAHFTEKGWDVKDRSKTESYDLLCRREDELLYVEVKGTTGAGGSVVLTRNEVQHVRRYPSALFILHHVELKAEDGKVQAVGGLPLLIEHWKPKDADLLALAYRYTVPSV